MSWVRINLLLLVILLVSAVALVYTQTQARLVFMQLETENARSNTLVIERDTLEIYRRAGTSPTKVEEIAKVRLQMQNIPPQAIRYVKRPASRSQGGG